LLSDNGFYRKTQIFRDRVTIAFSDNLTGVLNRKFDLQVIVPGGIGFEFAFSDPFGIIFIDVFDFKIMRDVKFIQSDPDCKCNMASLRV